MVVFFHCFFLIPVLTVSFEEPTYTVIESDGVLMVTIVADGTSSEPFDVEITAIPGSATGRVQ